MRFDLDDELAIYDAQARCADSLTRSKARRRAEVPMLRSGDWLIALLIAAVFLTAGCVLAGVDLR